MTIQITIDGNVGIMPDKLNQKKDGSPVLNFTVAHNHRETDAEGVWQTKSTSWFKVACFGVLAENLFSELKVGSPVFVQGNLKILQYKNPSTGAVSVSAEIKAENAGVNQKWAKKSDSVVVEPTH